MLNDRLSGQGDVLAHIEDSFRNGDFTDMEHTEEMIALLQSYNLTAEYWVYGSYCRPLSGTWFRVEGATLMQNTASNSPYTYVAFASRQATVDVDANELDLVSRPARKVN